WPNGEERTQKNTRINKAFVKALRARVCLNAAGYSQRPDGTPDGSVLRLSADPELSKDVLYPIAKQELMDVLNNPAAGHLEPSFETVFRKLCEENQAAGGESLWEVPLNENRGRMAYTFAVQHTEKDQYQQMGGQGGQVGPTPHFFYDYDIKDTRRDVTCLPYKWSGNPAKQVFDTGTAVKRWNFGKYRFEWMKRIVANANDDGLRKQYMRYAEVLLMLAEINNELEGPSAAAPFLKKIRERAFVQSDWPQKVDAYINALSSKEAMFNAIMDEYALEFAGEMLRKECLIRWNQLGAKMRDSKVRMAELRDRRDRYADVPATVYYRYAADGETLITYGLNRGEFENKSSEYTGSVEWVGPGKIKDDAIDVLFANDPDTKQFWPIWQYFLSNSNGMLVNDYGY
ncbi:MAG: RagB/SusD family nutrient uptake outer membrane protein, partial [Bacteroidales bacterium]|nr:RagB/SusD family nutrient uptake outer membrane protein [Bacteroidales bacterium]